MLVTHASAASKDARRDLMERIADARQRTDELFAIVKADSLYERPIAERHRIIFYIGHLEAFDWNLLSNRVFGVQSIHPEFDRLFAFGIDPVGGGLPNDQASEWPSIAAVRDYVAEIRKVLDDKLGELRADIDAPVADGFSLDTFLNVAIEHRLMHAETLAYMLHQLPLERKIRQAEAASRTFSPVVQESIKIPAGPTTLGLKRDSGIFGWDNEFEEQTIDVPAFSMDRYKVTNGQYREFIEARGYQTPELWNDVGASGDADWEWVAGRGISHPAFWRREGNEWLYRTMFEDIALPLDWPVYVSQAEAKAYARWVGKRLPTEAEWQRAAYGTGLNPYPWGEEFPDESRGNFDFARWSPVPVNAFPQGRSSYGIDGMVGNGWEWTGTEFAPLPGFEPFPFYRGYSADFFDGKHFVMKGGSARTAGCMLRSSFRNWFQAHYQFIYTGFRCVSG
jgi:ergothioneine biosynthesis protein EgtB